MSTFAIQGLGGRRELAGVIPVYGEKNTVLSIMAACALIEGEVTLTNVPGITDVGVMGNILQGLGGYITKPQHTERTLVISAKELLDTVLDPQSAKSLRASILLSGPLLARNRSVTFPMPGGDVIGSRPIDIFIRGFEALGATYTAHGDSHTLDAPKGLSGGEIFFRTVSVTATETFIMAGTMANAPVTLKNAAMEPQVVATAEFLKSCGARIEGAGTHTIIIHPSSLTPPSAPFRIIPDRIEAGSFLTFGALLGREITVTGVEPRHMDASLDILRSMGVPISIKNDAITVSAPEKLLSANVRTHEYPGFPTDLQAPTVVALTQAEGMSTVQETIFDGRLNYTAELKEMGANINLVSPHRAEITGVTPLKARDFTTPDIRAGLAFILAGAVAEGRTTVGNAHLVDRGYESIEKRLADVGLTISRI